MISIPHSPSSLGAVPLNTLDTTSKNDVTLLKDNPQKLTMTEQTYVKRELIVVANKDFDLRATNQGVASLTQKDISPLNRLLTTEQLTLTPLFGISEERLQVQAASLATETGTDVPDLSVYYHIEAADERLETLVEQFQQIDSIEAAYIKPPAQPADFNFNDMAPRTEEPPMNTPDFSSRQNYLEAAPTGVNTSYAWTLQGGRGTGVNIIDIEWGWRFTHEDLIQNQGGVVSGNNSPNDNHGTAVIGEIGGDPNTFGITGISPEARVSAVSLVNSNTAPAIRTAADRLQAGDIILLEVHRRGPRSAEGNGQFGFIAIEWWPDDFAAIRYAVSKGIIVVEAGGNGGQNLDDSIYNAGLVNDPRYGTFPSSWRNPFNPNNPSSGAVIVGAGLPPSGTHGRTREPGSGDIYTDRGRCFFSNYGARIDAQGWGWEVTTTGYGDLQGGADRNHHYTDQFSGTSSASPIVVGALACVQGILRAQNKPLLSSDRAIQLLRATGSPQQDGPGFRFIPNMTGSGYPQTHPARPRTQRIGNRPDLRQLIARALKVKPLSRHGLWVNASWSSFLAKWKQWNAQGLRLVDFEITKSGSNTRYSGVFRQGTGGHGLWVNASWSSFLAKWKQWNAQGLRLVDFEITKSGSNTRYSGVFRQGTGSHGLWVNASWSSFLAKWKQWNAQGLRLVDFEITKSGSNTRYSGVFRQGTGGHGLWVNASWSSFLAKWKQWNAQGLQLVDFEITKSGSKTRYSGVFRQGTGGHGLWVNASWSSFLAKWKQWNAQGLRLVDFEITKSGSNTRYSGVFLQDSSSIIDQVAIFEDSSGSIDAAFHRLTGKTEDPEGDEFGFGAVSFGESENLEITSDSGYGEAYLDSTVPNVVENGYGAVDFDEELSEAMENGYGAILLDDVSPEAETDGYGEASFEASLPEGESVGYGEAIFDVSTIEAEENHGDMVLDVAVSEEDGYGEVFFIA